MLKKYLNYYNAPYVFLYLSLTVILTYAVSLTLFLSMPPEGMPEYTVFERGICILDHLVSSLVFTVISFCLMRYIFSDSKKK